MLGGGIFFQTTAGCLTVAYTIFLSIETQYEVLKEASKYKERKEKADSPRPSPAPDRPSLKEDLGLLKSPSVKNKGWEVGEE